MDEPRSSRRQVLRTAAWATPVVLAAVPAPAFAASACFGFTFGAMPGSGTSGNGWSRPTNTNMSTTDTNNFITNPSLGTGYSVLADPTSITAASTILIQTSTTVTLGARYTFAWKFEKYGGNPRQLTCQFEINGAAQTGGLMDSDSAEANYTTLSRSVTYTPTSTGVVTVGYRFTFPAPVGTLSTTGDDMQVYSPSVSCTLI